VKAIITPTDRARADIPHRSTAWTVLLLVGILMVFPTVAPAQQDTFVPDWVKSAVFYQIFPDRFANGDPTNDPPHTELWGDAPTRRNHFGGDLQGIIDHLDYLKQLGVNAVYLNPIFEAPSNHKYDTRDYMRVDPQFGDTLTLHRLIDACHRHSIRIILDGVFNHTGVQFFAFADVKEKGSLSVYKDWYSFKSFPVGPASNPNYDCWWGYGSLPRLNTDNPAVREYLFSVTRKWMDLGIDGWRLDVPNEISHEFWREWRTVVKSINPDAYIVGEIWEDGSPWLQGDQFDAVMNYRFRNACLDFFVQRKIGPAAFDEKLEEQRKGYPDEVSFALLNLLGSHDTERFLTLCSGNTAVLKLAMLFQMTYPGAPMVYYGDELGMQGGKDPGCRGTMVWEKGGRDTTLLRFTQNAIAIRNSHRLWRTGTIHGVLEDEKQGVYGFMRVGSGARGLVLLNRNDAPATVTLDGSLAGRWRCIWPAETVAGAPAGTTAVIPPISGVVYLEEGS
jgi:cyclomaltodextrinase / maltogenic alpha-amylase / neopullulanase